MELQRVTCYKVPIYVNIFSHIKKTWTTYPKYIKILRQHTNNDQWWPMWSQPVTPTSPMISCQWDQLLLVHPASSANMLPCWLQGKTLRLAVACCAEHCLNQESFWSVASKPSGCLPWQEDWPNGAVIPRKQSGNHHDHHVHRILCRHTCARMLKCENMILQVEMCVLYIIWRCMEYILGFVDNKEQTKNKRTNKQQHMHQQQTTNRRLEHFGDVTAFYFSHEAVHDVRRDFVAKTIRLSTRIRCVIILALP